MDEQTVRMGIWCLLGPPGGTEVTGGPSLAGKGLWASRNTSALEE